MALTKAQVNVLRARGAHETFAHEHDGEFDITETWKAISQNLIPFQRVAFPLTDDIAHLTWTNREIDFDRVCDLTPDELLDPILILLTDTGKHILADGSHRLMRLWFDGAKEVRAFMVPISAAIRPNKAGMVELDWGQGNAIFEQKSDFQNK